MYEHKHLNILGLLGLMVVAFISITFNMDVLYRTADREFFIKYSDERMRSSYQAYLGQVQRELDLRRDQLLRATARQEGELDAEVRGLRAAPAGYGQRAKQEEYRLDILRRTNAVEIERIEAALARKAEADRMMVAPVSGNLDQVMNLQAQVRGAARDAGAAIGLPLPPPVRLESPLFVVVARLFDWQTVGLKEFFFLAIAVFLDLGDIIGYSLVPNRRPRSVPALPAPEPKPGPAVPTRVVEAGA
jgi:hypothetical protein